MKKVLLVAYACSPERGSEAGIGWSWATNLAKKGNEVWCLTNTEDKDITLAYKKKFKLDNLHFIFVSLPFGLDKLLLNESSKRIYFHYALWKKSAYNSAYNLHKKHKFDVAHHVSYGSFQQGTFLWKLKDIKIIFGPAGGGQMALPELKHYFGKAWKTEVLRNFISKLSLRFSTDLMNTIKKADYILTANRETEDLLQKSPHYKPGTSSIVLDSAVPASMENMEFVERKPGSELNLLWVGRLLPRKGLNLILHALSYLPENVKYKLNIVGGGEQRRFIKDWIKEYKLDSSRISVLGKMPFAEVAEWYKKSDVFIFCSLRDSFGSQIMEAMAFGLPVIVLDVSGASLGVPANCGIKVKPGTRDETALRIAQAIEKFYYDPKFRAATALNAYNHAKEATWENKVESVINNFY